MRGAAMAVLRSLLGGRGGVIASGLRAMRSSTSDSHAGMPGLPTRRHPLVTFVASVRWSGQGRPHATEVLRDAFDRRSAGALDAPGGGAVPAARLAHGTEWQFPGRVDVGPTGEAAETRARIRPGRGAVPGAASAYWMEAPTFAPAGQRDATAGDAVGTGSKARPAGSVSFRGRAPVPGPARRRRPDHGSDGRRVRRRTAAGRRSGGRCSHGGAFARRAASGSLLYSRRTPAWVCGCPGDVLPVVDASRRRNDPRKTTIGRRAWCGLDVSPALGRAIRRGEDAKLPFGWRPSQQASVGPKTRSARLESRTEVVVRWPVTFGERGERAWT